MTAKKPTKPAPKPKAKQPKGSGEPTLTRFQRFAPKRMHRREIKGAPYNPREIEPANKKRLRAILDVDNGGVGLIEPVTVNEVTGNLVGGHQRLAILDALEGHDNYLLDVSLTSLTEKQEVESNLALNNGGIQGQYVASMVEKLLLETPDLNLEMTGFTPLDLSLNFENPELAGLFTPNEATADLLSEVAAQGDDAKQARSGRAGGSNASDDDGDPEDSPASNVKPSTSEAAKAFRKQGKERFSAEDDTEVYAIVVMKSRAEREAFCTHFGWDPNDRYLDGSGVLAKLEEGLVVSKLKEQSKGKGKKS